MIWSGLVERLFRSESSSGFGNGALAEPSGRMSFARHPILLLAGVLLGLGQLVFPETVARLSAALSRLLGREPSEDEIREGARAFRIIGVLTLVFVFFILLGIL